MPYRDLTSVRGLVQHLCFRLLNYDEVEGQDEGQPSSVVAVSLVWRKAGLERNVIKIAPIQGRLPCEGRPAWAAAESSYGVSGIARSDSDARAGCSPQLEVFWRLSLNARAAANVTNPMSNGNKKVSFQQRIWNPPSNWQCRKSKHE